MSIEPTGATGPAAKRWRVRWRDHDGPHSQRVFTKREAEYLDAQIKRSKTLGAVGLSDLRRGTGPLKDFITERWWPNYAQAHLAESTRIVRRQHWHCYIEPLLGHIRLRDLTAEHNDLLAAELLRRELAPQTRRTVLGTYTGILNKAVEWGELAINPAAGIKRPSKVLRKREITLLTPDKVEAIRRQLDPRGAVMVSLMAYAGLRPVEMRGLEWPDVRERTILVRMGPSKTSTARTVPLLAPLGEDLATWQDGAAGGPVIPTTREGPRHGRVMSGPAFGQWRLRDFVPATEAAGLSGVVPYDLRHSFVSLMIQAGYQILEVARMAGHRPTECLNTYGHLFDEFDPSHRLDPEDLIREARNHG